MRRPPIRSIAAATLLTASLALGCTVAAPEHCANLAGDRTCEVVYGPGYQCSQCSLSNDGCTTEPVAPSCSPTEGLAGHCAYQAAPDDFCVAQTAGAAPFCSICAGLSADAGCVAAPPTDACDGDADGSGTGTGTDTGTDTDTGEESTTGSPPECTEADGEVSAACEALDPAAPFCSEAGTCITCDDAIDPDGACLNQDPTMPACLAGVCVQCTTNADCGGTTPICDALMCRPCGAHEECTDSACKLASGACFDPADVRWVDGGKDDMDCVGADGQTEATAVCNFSAAKATLGSEGVIFFKNFAATYPDTMQVTSGEEFALIGAGVSRPGFDPDAGPFAVLAVSSATVYLARVNFLENSQSSAIICTDPDATESSAVYVTEANLWAFGRYGIESVGCDLFLDRARIWNNSTGGIDMSDGSLFMVNTSVAHNGVFGDPNATGGLRLTDVTVDRFAYNSVVYNQAIDGVSSDTLTCAGTNVGELRNSIFSGRSIESVADQCAIQFTISNSAVDLAALVGGSNVDAGAPDNSRFVSVISGDLHLAPAAPLAWVSAASWEAGDPLLDIDGQPRDGATSAVGVDEPTN